MLSAVWKTIRREGLLSPGERVVVAVSGGPDSMALLAVLWELAPRLELRLEVATVDHGLRPEAAAEAALVAERAAALGLPFHCLAVDVAAARTRGRASVQVAARTLRLGALEDLAQRLGAGRVALGHNADDQAETVLFRVLRGTGVRGLAGIPYRRGLFIRPLLDVPRATIDVYVKRRSLPVVRDPSNDDGRFTRARLRHRVLPLLRQENPRVAEALRALAADARRLVTPALTDDAPLGYLGRSAAAAVADLRRRGGTGFVDVPGGRVQVAYGQATRLPVGWRTPSPAPALRPDATLSIAKDGMFWLGGPVGIEVRAGASAAAPSVDPSFAAYDAEYLAAPLVLRARRAGDRMRPRGGRGSRKVSDLLIDAKIARAERPSLPVLTAADGTILYVPGLRPSEVGRPGAATRRWFFVRSLRREKETSV